jgi:predicted esterase
VDPERARPERFSVPYLQSVPVELRRPARDADGSLVLALHGMGMSPRSFTRDVLPAVPERSTVLLPRGPLPFEQREPTGIKQGNAWYIYTGDGPALLDSLGRAENWLLYVLDAALGRGGLDRERVSLVGFSQGGYMAGWLGVRHPGRFDRLVVAGGRIKDESLSPEERATLTASTLRVLAVHGEDDPGVSPAAARRSVEALAALGLDATFRSYPCEHAVLRDPDCRNDVRSFLV